MSNEIRKRMDYIDSIKGFAIFLVVMGHAIAGPITTKNMAKPLMESM